MKSLMKYILALGFLFIWSCSDKDDELNKETEVINSIFKQLTDSMLFFSVYPPPPPPPFSSSLFSKDKEKLLMYSERQKKYNDLISMMDTSRHILSIYDTLKIDDNNFVLAIPYIKKSSDNSGYSEAFESYVKKRKKELPIDISKITNTGRYKLATCKNRHEIYGNKKYPKYKYSYHGILTLSRVYFNHSYDRGFLVCSIYGGPDCYNCKLIFIKKDSIGWKIDEMELLSIS